LESFGEVKYLSLNILCPSSLIFSTSFIAVSCVLVLSLLSRFLRFPRFVFVLNTFPNLSQNLRSIYWKEFYEKFLHGPVLCWMAQFWTS
jgi:hypothetical protein